MSPSVVCIVAEFASGEGPERAWPVLAAATLCSSRVGRSLKTSRSPDLSLQRRNKSCEIEEMLWKCILWFRSSKEVESWFFVASANECWISLPFVCKNRICRSCHCLLQQSKILRKFLKRVNLPSLWCFSWMAHPDIVSGSRILQPHPFLVVLLPGL